MALGLELGTVPRVTPEPGRLEVLRVGVEVEGRGEGPRVGRDDDVDEFLVELEEAFAESLEVEEEVVGVVPEDGANMAG